MLSQPTSRQVNPPHARAVLARNQPTREKSTYSQNATRTPQNCISPEHSYDAKFPAHAQAKCNFSWLKYFETCAQHVSARTPHDCARTRPLTNPVSTQGTAAAETAATKNSSSKGQQQQQQQEIQGVGVSHITPSLFSVCLRSILEDYLTPILVFALGPNFGPH